MAKVKLKCVDGSLFEYDDKTPELYRIIQSDGNVRLKLEGCPEVLITNKKPRKSRNHLVDVYLITVLDPAQMEESIPRLLKGLKLSFPYLDAYVVPANKNDVTSEYNNDLLYNSEYNCQTFFLLLAGEKLDEDSSYYVHNLIGSISSSDIQGWVGNVQHVDVFGDNEGIIYDVASIPRLDNIRNRTFGAGFHKGMAKKIATRLKLSCSEFGW